MKGVSFSVPDQERSNLWIIQNTNDGQIYTFDEDTKKCYKLTNPIKAYSCLPGMETHTSYYLFLSFILFQNFENNE